MSEYLVPIAIITVLVLVNGLFVAAEFAIIGVRPTRLAQLAADGNRTADRLRHTIEDPARLDRYIATSQLGITLASLGLGMYGEHAIAEWLLGPLERWFGLGEALAHSLAVVGAVALLTFAHVVVGEMVPKSLALQYAERTALGISGVMAVMRRLFYPAVLVLNAIGNGLLRLLGFQVTTTDRRLYSPEELELLVTESHEGGLLTDSEEQLIHNIFDFSERRVGQVMTPRMRVAALPADLGPDELRQRVVTSPYSRFPVYEGDIDHVVGLLLLKDYVRQQIQDPQTSEWRSLVRHLPSVPESMPVEALMAAFKRSHVHMALVVDEYGGTAGLVTLEDLVEEVVGEVHDEFDQNELPPLREVEPGVFVARGDLLIEDLTEDTPIRVPDDEDLPDVETIGGLVVDILGRPPRVGDTVELQGTTYTVETVAGLAVSTLRIVLDQAQHAREARAKDEGRRMNDER